MHRAPTEYRLTKAIQGACTLQWLLKILNAQHGCSHDPCPKLIKRRLLASTMAISGSQICQPALLERSDWPKKDASRRTSQQLQQCAAALPFALTIYVACPAPCSFDVRTLTPYPLRTPDGRRFSKPLPASVLLPVLRHRPCTGTININLKSANVVRLINRDAYIERVHERIWRTCHVIQLHIDGGHTH